MVEVSAQIEIHATPRAVWEALTDLASYPQWNPLFPRASGRLVVGQRVRLVSAHPVTGRKMTVKPKVLVVDPGRELRWVASLPGVMTGEHSFVLTGTDSGTLLIQRESFRGLLARTVSANAAAYTASLQAMNEAIKTRVESGST